LFDKTPVGETDDLTEVAEIPSQTQDIMMRRYTQYSESSMRYGHFAKFDEDEMLHDMIISLSSEFPNNMVGERDIFSGILLSQPSFDLVFEEGEKLGSFSLSYCLPLLGSSRLGSKVGLGQLFLGLRAGA
jgi:hypothetical protein